MPRYVFRWRCWDQAASIVVIVEAPTDAQAGLQAAAMLQDLSKGRRGELRWLPDLPIIERGP